MTKQAEIFVFLAMFFLLAVVFVEQGKESSDPLAKQAPASPVDSPEDRDDRPPIIILSEDDQDFRFELGSARVPTSFRRALGTTTIPLLDSLSQRYSCNAIEIIGHTDASAVISAHSDLDDHLVRALRTGQSWTLTPGSNADLGMMRAAAILTVLRHSQRTGHLKGIRHFLPYSAGQLILIDGELAQRDSHERDRSRRRIEIRLLQLSPRPHG